MIELIKEKIKEIDSNAFMITSVILFGIILIFIQALEFNAENIDKLEEKTKILKTIYNRDFESYEQWLYYENHKGE